MVDEEHLCIRDRRCLATGLIHDASVKLDN